MTSAQLIKDVGETTADSKSRFGPGQRDMWYFILFDSSVFSCYLISYIIFRIKNPAEFLASQEQMSQGLGIFNTVLLLTSSWFLARCVRYTRHNELSRALQYLMLTAVAGVSFMVVKSIEWFLAIKSGFTLTYSLYFSFYYFITGFHMVHMAVGLVALFYIYHNLRNPKDNVLYSVETGSTYWHMVDLLWVYIFALLYLMR